MIVPTAILPGTSDGHTRGSPLASGAGGDTGADLRGDPGQGVGMPRRTFHAGRRSQDRKSSTGIGRAMA